MVEKKKNKFDNDMKWWIIKGDKFDNDVTYRMCIYPEKVLHLKKNLAKNST